MSFITLRTGRDIGDYLKPYIVAELNTSHFGDIEIAKQMIEQARLVGCDCVKFQSWSAESLYCEDYYRVNKIAKRMVTKFSLSNDQLKELSSHAKVLGIDFASTPYSIDEAIFLVEECGVPFIKIASMELNNIPYLTELSNLGVPLVLSTGMGTMEEIGLAVEAIRSAGNSQLIILHCTSVYPASPNIIRLQNIATLRDAFAEYPIGYSDHSIGIEIPAASVALGACLVEKHFTLDSAKIGMDNQMATEPEEMRSMIAACHRVYEAMGGSERILSQEEQDQAFKMRRSMVAKVNLFPGDFVTDSVIEFKRPGNGIPPSSYKQHLNKRIINHVEVGAMINLGDIEQ